MPKAKPQAELEISAPPNQKEIEAMMARQYELGKETKKMERERKEITELLKPIVLHAGGRIDGKEHYAFTTTMESDDLDPDDEDLQKSKKALALLEPFMTTKKVTTKVLDWKSAKRTLSQKDLKVLEPFIKRTKVVRLDVKRVED